MTQADMKEHRKDETEINTKINLNLTNIQKCKNCSRVCVYHCAQLSYTTQHRTVLIIFPLILHKHQSSDAVYWRETAARTEPRTSRSKCNLFSH